MIELRSRETIHKGERRVVVYATEQQIQGRESRDLIKKRLGIESVITPGETGQLEVLADGERIAGRGGNWFTRSFGAGYADLDTVVEQLQKRRG